MENYDNTYTDREQVSETFFRIGQRFASIQKELEELKTRIKELEDFLHLINPLDDPFEVDSREIL